MYLRQFITASAQEGNPHSIGGELGKRPRMQAMQRIFTISKKWAFIRIYDENLSIEKFCATVVKKQKNR